MTTTTPQSTSIPSTSIPNSSNSNSTKLGHTTPPKYNNTNNINTNMGSISMSPIQ